VSLPTPVGAIVIDDHAPTSDCGTTPVATGAVTSPDQCQCARTNGPAPLPHLHTTIANSIIRPLINDGAGIHDGKLATSPSPTSSFTAHMPMSPQQHYEDIFYGSVDGIRASMAQLQAAARCLLARRQGQRPIFKRKRPVVPATLQQLTERKAIARASTYKVFVVVWLQAAALGLLVRQQMLEAALVSVDLGTWGRNLGLSDDHQEPRWPAVSKREHGACPADDELQLYDSGGREGTPLLVIGVSARTSPTTFHYRPL
jgi:hypothetical protein